ncbi:Predicted Zn-dependent peptidase [Parapedobacter composti]|uniref:Predicted Zn-dependent peptidase n=1 Tax=Parapedobacter composti TaxID=623281 RepID=A0A1I1GQ41_9SPHI|nr:pitrilysin family protein [Parapedobacter composti]SFC11373.1 Predicted Zn-dependent peptidase [Parapedobacter composti]
MVTFERFTLANGLRVLVHEDNATPMAVVNILYDVGARDEDPERTGFAHLFEHLMFGGSVNIPNYDGPLQRVGGQNNAFTSNDITNYYITLPAANLETAFWLESDRMLGLAFSEKSLEVQRSVVCEEFKQRYLDQPYGDAWLRLRPLAYKEHPYRWATIGKELAHIEQASMDDVKAFFARHYAPDNAIMVVAGNVETGAVRQLAEKWFGPIPPRGKGVRSLTAEPPQREARREIVHASVPQDNLYIAFHGPARLDRAYHTMDLLSDLLSQGASSRLYRRLVKEKPLFSEINAYQTGSIDPGLLVVEGKPLPDVPIDTAENAIWAELEALAAEPVGVYELNKVKNKVESTLVFGEMAILEKAMNLAYFELLGDAGELNREVDRYLSVTADDIQQLAAQMFRKENSSTLIYIAHADA